MKPAIEYCEGTFWRTARKAHACYGLRSQRDPLTGRRGHAAECKGILPGITYLEYVGESGCYESGQRFTIACADMALRTAEDVREVTHG